MAEHRLQPVVSIIVPCYNQAAFLSELLLSVAQACHHPHEVIIIDDGSTDLKTAFFLNALRPCTPQQEIVLVSQRNKGLSMARNKGMDIARGEYIQFLDSDDLLFPRKIDRQILSLEENPDRSIHVCEYVFCNATRDKYWGPERSTILGIPLGFENFLLSWEKTLSIPIHCALFRASAIGPIRFAPNVLAKEDFLFWLTLISHGACFEVSDFVGAVYRQHGNNMCRNQSAMGIAWLQAINYLQHSPMDFDRTLLKSLLQHFNRAYAWSMSSSMARNPNMDAFNLLKLAE